MTELTGKVRVVFVQRFMLHYRKELFERISSDEDLDFTLLHGKGFKKSKFVNYKGEVSYRHKQLKTIQYHKESNAQFLVYSPSLFWQLRKHRADVVVFEGESNMLNNVQVWLYSLIFRKKIIWWGLGLIPGFSETTYQKLYRPILKRMLNRACKVIGYSDYARNYYSGFTNQNKIVVANNCLDNEAIDQEIIQYLEESKRLKTEYNLQDKFVFIYVGAFIPRKNVDRLIEAYLHNKSQHPDSALIIVGGGALDSDLKALVKDKNIQDVIFTGKVISDISKYFLMADLFVLPGLGGLSIHHAMVHSLPVISASADGTERDLIEVGRNGFLLETETMEELSGMLKKFLDNRSLAIEFGKRSREIVDQKVNINKKVETFVKAIKDCGR